MAGFIETVFGKKRAATGKSLATIDDVQRALQCLAQEREAAQRKVAGSGEARRSLLLVDGSDAKIIELDKETDAARLHLERCDIGEEILLGRLRELQDKARRELFDALLGSFRERESQLDAALAAIVEPLANYMEAVHQLDAANFTTEAAPYIVRAPLVGDGIQAGAASLEHWRRQREAVADRRAAAETRKAAPPAIPAPGPYRAAPLVVHPRTPPKLVERKVADAPLPEYRPSPRRAPIKAEGRPAFGFMKIVVLRPGFEIEGKQRVVGDEIILPNAEADKWLRTGGCEVVERGEIGSEAAE